MPAVLSNQAFREQASSSSKSRPFVIGLERTDGSLSRHEMEVFSSDDPRSGGNVEYVENILKFLLWQKGGWKVYLGGFRHFTITPLPF